MKIPFNWSIDIETSVVTIALPMHGARWNLTRAQLIPLGAGSVNYVDLVPSPAGAGQSALARISGNTTQLFNDPLSGAIDGAIVANCDSLNSSVRLLLGGFLEIA